MPTWARSLHDKVDRLDHHLTGGSEPTRGMIVRVDRLEQTEARRKFWTTTALGAALTAFVGSIYALVTGKHS